MKIKCSRLLTRLSRRKPTHDLDNGGYHSHANNDDTAYSFGGIDIVVNNASAIRYKPTSSMTIDALCLPSASLLQSDKHGGDACEAL
jgi:NAD(P)-dependent dehydrogenase (short-subunit alcohol dehydrogenase family)